MTIKALPAFIFVRTIDLHISMGTLYKNPQEKILLDLYFDLLYLLVLNMKCMCCSIYKYLVLHLPPKKSSVGIRGPIQGSVCSF